MAQTYPALHMMIDGERVAGGGRRTFAVRNPATGATIGELPLAEVADLDRALEAAARGFARWRTASAAERAAALEGAARQIVGNQLGAGGATNEWYQTAEVVVVPWLA